MELELPRRYVCRYGTFCQEKVVEMLQEAGTGQRRRIPQDWAFTTYQCCRTPYLTQWFVAMRTLVDKALEAVTSGEVKFIPVINSWLLINNWLRM